MGDMAALNALRERVAEGTRYTLTDHDYIAHSGDRVVTRTYVMDDQTWRNRKTGETGVTSKGGPAFNSRPAKGSGPESYYQWPTSEDDDFEVEGTTLRVYKPYHAYTGGRAIILTFEFHFDK